MANILNKIKPCCTIFLMLTVWLVGCDKINMEQDSEQLSVSQSVISINYNGVASSFNIQTDVEWSIVPEQGEHMPSWISSILPLSGNGSAKVVVIAMENAGGSRNTKIKVVAANGESQTLTVNQARGTITEGSPKAIAQIRAMITGSDDALVSDNYTITGRIVSDRLGRNMSSRQFVIQDDITQGSGLVVCFMEESIEHIFNMGDQVSINLSDAVLFYDNGVLKIQVYESETRKTLAPAQVPLPVEVDVSDLAGYESMFVALKESQIADTDISKKTYAGKIKMTTKSGEINYSMQTNYIESVATWAYNPISIGSGTVRGIVEVCGQEDFVVLPRNIADIDLSGERYVKILPVKYGQSTFSGMLALNKTGSQTRAKILVPYLNGDGSTVSGFTVQLSGAGAEGLSVSQTSFVLGTGDDNVEIAIDGTPTVEGPVTFTIQGINKLSSPKNICSTMVLPASAAREKLDIEFNLAPNPFEEEGKNTPMVTYSNGCTLTSAQGAKIQPSTTTDPMNSAIYTGDWNVVDNGFVFGIPVTFDVYGLHEVKLYAWNADKAPAVYKLLYSTDNKATWTPGDSGKDSYTLNGSGTKAVPSQFTLQFTIPDDKLLSANGVLYVKLWADISKGGVNGTSISSGNARLNYMFSVKGQ